MNPRARLMNADAQLPFSECNNCGRNPTLDELETGDCPKCGDSLIVYTVDVAKWIRQQFQADAFSRPVTAQSAPGQEIANARLIAAAPDLLEAAREAESVMSIAEGMGLATAQPGSPLYLLRAAIAKAEGQS